MRRFRTLLPVSVALVSAFALLALPTASQATSERGVDSGFDGLSSWGDDALTPRPGMRPLRGVHPRMGGPGAVYDMHFYLLATPTRSMVLTRTKSEAYVQQLNQYYAGQLGAAAPTFRFTSFTVVPTQEEDTCGIGPAEAAIGRATLDALRPTAGAADATWLIVSPDVRQGVECALGGQAWLNARGSWVRHGDSAETNGWFFLSIVHEIGHNLGLTHSGKVHTRNGVAGWQGDGYDDFKTYGDQADPMGSAPYKWNTGLQLWERPTVNLHGHNRNLLGGIPSSGITSVVAGSTVTISLAPVTATSGTRLVYLPMFNRAKFYLEYRTATGVDSPLVGQYAPGAGVYLRMVNTRHDAGPGMFDPGAQPPWWPDSGTISWTAESWEDGSQAYSVRQGHVAGDSMSLPDGTTISVGVLSPSVAQVLITRPADTSPPTFETHAYLEGCYSPLDGTSCVLRTRESAPGEVMVDLTLPRVTDDQWVSTLTVAVDGVVVARRVSPAAGIAGTREGLAEGLDAEVVPLSLRAGSRVVTITATDVSGLTYVESSTVAVNGLSPASAPTGFRWQRFADDEIGLYWSRPSNVLDADVLQYQIEQSVDGGEWVAKGSIDGPEVLMTLLPQDTPIRFRVAAETEAGLGAWGVTDPILLPARTVPSPPRQVTLTPANRSIKVSWQVPASDGGVGVTGYIATASNGAFCTGLEATRECTISGIDNGVAYTVSVVATNRLGNSAPATAGPVTPVGLPGKVTGLRGKITGTAVRVTWGVPTDTGGLPITGYRYRIDSQVWRTTSQAAITFALPRRASSVSISVQAGNAVGYGPELTVKARVPGATQTVTAAARR